MKEIRSEKEKYEEIKKRSKEVAEKINLDYIQKIKSVNRLKEYIKEKEAKGIYKETELDSIERGTIELELKELSEKMKKYGKIAGKMHKEIVQNIDSTATRAINNAMKDISRVNGEGNEYKTKNTKIQEKVILTGQYGEEYETVKHRKISLDEMMEGEVPEFKFVKEYYENRIGILKEQIEEYEGLTKADKEKLLSMSEKELKESFFYRSNIGAVKELVGTWYEENSTLLTLADVGIAILATALAPATFGGSLIAYGGIKTGKLLYEISANDGRNILTGEKMKTGDYLLAGIDITTSLLGGLAVANKLNATIRITEKMPKLGGTLGSIVSKLDKIEATKLGKVVLQVLNYTDNKMATDLAINAITSGFSGALNGDSAEEILQKVAMGVAFGTMLNLFGKGISKVINESITIEYEAGKLKPPKTNPFAEGAVYEELSRHYKNKIDHLIKKEVSMEDAMYLLKSLHFIIDDNGYVNVDWPKDIPNDKLSDMFNQISKLNEEYNIRGNKKLEEAIEEGFKKLGEELGDKLSDIDAEEGALSPVNGIPTELTGKVEEIKEIVNKISQEEYNRVTEAITNSQTRNELLSAL